jgi:hypothetical protein
MYRMGWRSTFGLVLAGVLGAASVVMLPAAAQAQGPAATLQQIADRTDPQPPLPKQFIDSRPILAHFDGKPMPTTVRGLLETLRQPDVCGKGARTRADEACALVFYKLDENFAPSRLRPPLIIKAVYRITLPDNLAKTVMMIADSKGNLKTFNNEDLYEPLRTIRANVCLFDKRFPERCSPTGTTGVVYRPLGVLGNKENSQLNILRGQAADRFFGIYAKPADDLWMLPMTSYTTGRPEYPMGAVWGN